MNNDESPLILVAEQLMLNMGKLYSIFCRLTKEGYRTSNFPFPPDKCPTP